MNSVLARSRWILVVVLGLGLFRANARTDVAEIRWNELAALVVGHNVSIPFSGIVVEGEPLSVRDDSLMLDIRKTSDPSRCPKGQTSIPRTSVTEVRILEHGGAGGRILGSVVGALVGMVAGAEIAVHGTHSEAAGVSVFSATAVASTVGGYCAGRSADRHTRLLRIAPPSAGSGLPADEQPPDARRRSLPRK
jgi:hypothetical protein